MTRTAPDYSAVHAAIRRANRYARRYNRAVQGALRAYGEHGPWISGVGRDHFPEEVKDKLRLTLRKFHSAQDAVAAAFKLLHPRTDFYRSKRAAPFRDAMVQASHYGTGNKRHRTRNPTHSVARAHARDYAITASDAQMARNMRAVARKRRGKRSNPRTPWVDAVIENQIGADMAALRDTDSVPAGYWGEFKTILTVLRGNHLDHAASVFLNEVMGAPGGRPRLTYPHFYLDDRVGLRRVQSGWSNGAVGKREYNAALKSLQAHYGESRPRRNGRRRAR